MTVCVATFMYSLDTSIVFICLPTMARYFGVGLNQVSWVAVGYMLPLACLLLLFGRLGDLLGYRRVFLAGFALFTLASVLCAFSTHIWLLILFRVVQAVGGAMMASMSFAIVAAHFPEDRRGKAFGQLNVASSLALCVGPSLGGLLAQHLTWRAVFLVNLPVGVLGLVLGVIFLPKDEKKHQAPEFDVLGALLLLAGLGAALYAVQMLLDSGFKSHVFQAVAASSFLFLVLFTLKEMRTSHPLLDFGLLRKKNMPAANLGGFLFFLVIYGILFLLPFFLEKGRGLSAARSGLMMTLPPLMIVLSGALVGKLTDRLGSKPICTVGMAGLLGVLLLLVFSDMETSLWYTGATLIALGLFAGLFVIPNSSLIMGLAGENEHGVVSGLMNTLRRCGGMLGVSLFGILFSFFLQRADTAASITISMATDQQATQAFSRVCLAALGPVIFGLGLTLWIRGRHPHSPVSGQ